MTNRCYPLVALLFMLAVSAEALLSCPAGQERGQPNVLIIFPDQWRRQALGCNGDQNLRTPNIDGLAAEGVNFTRAYATNPHCSPSRAIFHTGRYAHHTGIIKNNFYLAAEEICFSDVFAEAGYRTGYIGKWHLDGPTKPGYVPPSRRQGFRFFHGFNRGHWYPTKSQYFSDSGERIKPRVFESIHQTDLAIDFLRRQKDQPFLLFLSYGTPHEPYRPPARFDRLIPEQLEWRPNVPASYRRTAGNARALCGYYGLCEMLDHEIGRILDFLDQSGLAESTLVWFTSDHGDAHGSHGLRHKGRPEEESMGIPLIVRGPGVKRGLTTDTLAGTIDFAPTLLSLCNLDVPKAMVGRDLTAALTGGAVDAPWLYTQGRMNRKKVERARETDRDRTSYRIIGAWRAIVTPRNKLVVDGRDEVSLLFDLDDDPFEMQNLAGHPQHLPLQEELLGKLREIGKQTGDPFPDPVRQAARKPSP